MIQKIWTWCTWIEQDECGRTREDTHYSNTENIREDRQLIGSETRRYRGRMLWQSPSFGVPLP